MLAHKVTIPGMTAAVCRDYCSDKDALFYATQVGFSWGGRIAPPKHTARVPAACVDSVSSLSAKADYMPAGDTSSVDSPVAAAV